MRNTILLFISVSFFCTKVNAQKGPDWEQKKVLFSALDQLLYDFEKNMHIWDVSNSNYNEVRIQFLKELFTKDAMLFDDVNPAFMTNIKVKDLFKLTEKTFDSFFSITKVNYPKGIDVTFTNAYFDYTNLKYNKADLFIEKSFQAFSKEGFDIWIHDTIKLELLLLDNYTKILIANIKQVNKPNIEIKNDNDHDLIINEKDNCKDIPGDPDPRWHGCPAPQGPSLFVGLQANMQFASNSIAGELKNNYNSLFEPKISNPKQVGISTVFGIQGEVDYYFGKIKRNYGISTGIGFQHLNMTMQIQALHIAYAGTDPEGNPYVRTINSDLANNPSGIKEKLSINMLDIPLYFKYKQTIIDNKKYFWSVDAGFKFRTYMIGKSNATIDADYELEQNGYNVNQNSPSENWVHTRNDRNRKYASNPAKLEQYKAQEKKLQDRGCDFELNKTFNKASDFKINPTLFFVLKPNMFVNISERILLNFGLEFSYGSTTIVRKDNYIILDKVSTAQTDYTSFMNGYSKYTNLSLGFNIGFKYGLNQPYFKN